MSEDGDSRTINPDARIHVNHWCGIEGCGRWGGFGFSSGREGPRWWCWEHYPHKPGRARSEAAGIAEAISLEPNRRNGGIHG